MGKGRLQMHNIIELIIIAAVFGSITLVLITLFLKFTKHDSTEHDIDFVWDRKYKSEDMDLERKH